MPRKPYDGYIPYDRHGNPMSWTGQKYPDPPDKWGHGQPSHGEWRPNISFVAALKVTGTERGRSAAHFILTDLKTGVNYNMFLTDMVDLIQQTTIVNGVADGSWAFAKRGQNFGVIFLG